LTNEGTASGATSSTVHTRRPGRSERSTSQAAPTPSTRLSARQPTVSRTVFQSRSAVRCRKISWDASAQPVCTASYATKPSGSSVSSATAVAASTSRAGGRGLRRLPAGAALSAGAAVTAAMA
jgi:hypothetical protein